MTTGLLVGVLSVGLLGSAVSAAAPSDGWMAKRVMSPSRTEIRDGDGSLLAELTDGSRTAVLRGPVRAWTEAATTTARIAGDRWVRLLPRAFDGTFGIEERAWLAAALGDRSPDALAVAFQYGSAAPDLLIDGRRIAGDARYGASAGGDFNDYLGISWAYATWTDQPEPAEYGWLDCSGFVRQVFGYRLGMPMSIGPTGSAATLPRRAADQLAGAPGRVVIGNAAQQVTALRAVRPGDLVFFDASTSGGSAIDHVGIVVGLDGAGHLRFISSRQKADGPTIGDLGGASILDGTGYWARALRAVRRL
jgi:cell wall-associated NlpC family hydrolase